MGETGGGGGGNIFRQWIENIFKTGTKCSNKVIYMGKRFNESVIENRTYFEKLIKLDGERCWLILYKNYIITVVGENPVIESKRVNFYFDRIGIFDCEILKDGHVWVFDLIAADGVLFDQFTYSFRTAYVSSFFKRYENILKYFKIFNKLKPKLTFPENQVDGWLYVLDDDTYYGTKIIKVPFRESVDLLCYEKTLLSYDNERLEFVEISRLCDCGSFVRNGIYRIDVSDGKNFTNCRKFLLASRRRTDKILPNDNRTVKLYLANIDVGA